MRTIVFILLLITIGCKTKQLKDAPSIDHIYDNLIDDELITDQIQLLGTDVISGRIINEDIKLIDLVAIKLTVNDSVCVNAYSDLDRLFSLNYDSSMINRDSFFEIVYYGYSRKKIYFSNFPKNGNILLDKSGKLISFEEYRKFYEEIRGCAKLIR
ncbi:hypothetical protein [Aquimarina sp. RZ0]|uniref:hypothetical protein n=1 Tax=Aquimarina sp. RZ0 TaxID=2607730 RepID=UPI0011F1E121|nr:hypothetical protein [Aquimarina sp. RZ0]KAA1243013.1 hypothetical protein F0000_22895 [Aquimarina sp. RZ0]